MLVPDVEPPDSVVPTSKSATSDHAVPFQASVYFLTPALLQPKINPAVAVLPHPTLYDLPLLIAGDEAQAPTRA